MYIFVIMSPYIIAVAKKKILFMLNFPWNTLTWHTCNCNKTLQKLEACASWNAIYHFFRERKPNHFFHFPIWETLNFGQYNNFGFHFTEIWQILYYILQKLISASIIFEEWQTHSSFWKMQYYWLVADPVPKTLVSRFLFSTQIALRQV